MTEGNDNPVSVGFETDQYGRYLAVTVPEGSEPWEMYEVLSGGGVHEPRASNFTIFEQILHSHLLGTIKLQQEPGDNGKTLVDRWKRTPEKETIGRDTAWQEISDLLDAGRFKVKYMASADQRVPEFEMPGSFYR